MMVVAAIDPVVFAVVIVVAAAVIIDIFIIIAVLVVISIVVIFVFVVLTIFTTHLKGVAFNSAALMIGADCWMTAL